MNIIKPLLLSYSLVAFAGASAYADDAMKNKSSTQAKPSTSQSSTSQSTKAPAGASASGGASASTATNARYDFDKADKNKDGRLSRAEFDAMLKGDTAASAGSSSKPATPKTGK